MIGLYFGDKKPSNLEFLQEFIADCKEMETNGLTVDDKIYYFRLSKILADAPARSFLKAVKNHNSYYGCERCNQRGEWSGRVVFNCNSSVLRTDSSFRSKRDIAHHNGDSIFLELDIDMVSQFPLDYLHLVCLGVVRKVLRQWVKGKLPHKLRHSDVDTISKRLLSFRKHFPNDFQRKPRSLFEVDHFKGTEFRTFLLYTGFPALISVLSTEKFKHFMYLHSAIFILLSKYCTNEWWNQLANKLLCKFIRVSIELYGREFVTYNVHSLSHLSSDCLEHGSLDKCSTFKFENFMQKLKRMVRSHSSQLEQVANRLAEKDVMDNTVRHKNIITKENSIVLSSKNGNNCFMTKDNKWTTTILNRITSARNGEELDHNVIRSGSGLFSEFDSLLECIVKHPRDTTQSSSIIGNAQPDGDRGVELFSIRLEERFVDESSLFYSNQKFLEYENLTQYQDEIEKIMSLVREGM
ncbi:unnamed protein product [Orchesella dallaii]|uniref:Transposase domain-containing protein n=1 Tax=Orchesella dallaii TaxID=48710 RepID=A0ABP1S2A5_9HEXA